MEDTRVDRRVEQHETKRRQEWECLQWSALTLLQIVCEFGRNLLAIVKRFGRNLVARTTAALLVTHRLARPSPAHVSSWHDCFVFVGLRPIKTASKTTTLFAAQELSNFRNWEFPIAFRQWRAAARTNPRLRNQTRIDYAVRSISFMVRQKKKVTKRLTRSRRHDSSGRIKL